MSCFILQTLTLDMIPEPRKVVLLKEIPLYAEYQGAFIVDNHVDTQNVVLTTDMLGRARRFETKEMAETFSDLGGLKALPTRVIRLDGVNAHSSGLSVS